MISRRNFTKGIALLAFSGLYKYSALSAYAKTASEKSLPLIKDLNAIIDLPENFSYSIVSRLGESMDDGLVVPDRADGMACFQKDDERVVLIRNHELLPEHGNIHDEKNLARFSKYAYDVDANGIPLPGGTSHIVYNLKTKQVETQFMSLIGTVRNCAGGATPWGSWLTCEESLLGATDNNKEEHGYVFEVPADASSMIEAEPLKAMGRFNHEAACVDPGSGIVYLTEDRGDGLLYRFLPNTKGKLMNGGVLQALAIEKTPKFDTRNWSQSDMAIGTKFNCTWVDLDNVESPNDDLRYQGFEKGAALFARGEGIIFGEEEFFFCCTNGGAKKLGQIMRYSPTDDSLELFLESTSPVDFNYGDNVCIAPNSHLIVCEDQYTEVKNNHIKGVKKDGTTYDLARIRLQTESAGVCFSPDNTTLFVNLYSPTMTLAISGPWMSL